MPGRRTNDAAKVNQMIGKHEIAGKKLYVIYAVLKKEFDRTATGLQKAVPYRSKTKRRVDLPESKLA